MSGKPVRETAVTMAQRAPFCDDILCPGFADVHSIAGLPPGKESREPLPFAKWPGRASAHTLLLQVLQGMIGASQAPRETLLLSSGSQRPPVSHLH